MNYETIIVGAGPAGLQMGYFLQKEGRPYCILERAPAAASLYEQFPHSGKLLSINKLYAGTELYDTALRHDWNSLLNDEQFSFKSYSREYYPAKEDFVQYMNDFAKRFKLRIQYHHTVKAIHKEADGTYRLDVDVSGGASTATATATCQKLILATGLSKPNLPKWLDQTKVRPKHYAEYPKDFFRKQENLEQFQKKSVLIVGNGNAAYELAKLLAPWVSHTRIYGRRSKPWAAATHYPGDLRANYLSIVDDCSFSNLQAIDTTFEGTLCLEQLDANDPYTAYTICSPTCHTKHRLASKHIFDRVIFATGWKMDTSPFQFSVPTLQDGMFPLVNSEFEVVGHPNLFCIGKLMHGFDYQESAGGFLHGYRHLIEYMASVQYKKKLSITIFKEGHENVHEVVNQIMVKLNRTSALFNLHGYMSDIFYYDAAKQDYVYVHNIPMNCLGKIIQVAPNTVVFQLTLEYGHPHKKTLDELGKVNQTSKEPALANLLHPVVRVFRGRNRGLTETGEGAVIEMVELIHFAEALYAEFTQKDEIFNKMIRLLKGYLP